MVRWTSIRSPPSPDVSPSPVVPPSLMADPTSDLLDRPGSVEFSAWSASSSPSASLALVGVLVSVGILGLVAALVPVGVPGRGDALSRCHETQRGPRVNEAMAARNASPADTAKTTVSPC